MTTIYGVASSHSSFALKMRYTGRFHLPYNSLPIAVWIRHLFQITAHTSGNLYIILVYMAHQIAVDHSSL